MSILVNHYSFVYRWKCFAEKKKCNNLFFSIITTFIKRNSFNSYLLIKRIMTFEKLS